MFICQVTRPNNIRINVFREDDEWLVECYRCSLSGVEHWAASLADINAAVETAAALCAAQEITTRVTT